MDSSPASRVISLPDGRAIGVCEYGDPDGRTVLYFHSHGGSRLEARPLSSVASRLGVRLVALDRPGCGLSTARPGRSLADWADDVDAVTRELGVDQCSLLGFSAGGTFALACAARHPDRLHAIAVVGAVGPLDSRSARAPMPRGTRAMFALARSAPFVVHALGRVAAAYIRRSPERAVDRLTRSLPPRDRQLLLRPDVGAADTVSEAFRQRGRGWAEEWRILASPWPFRLEEIKVPVRLWHGQDDHDVPEVIAREVASRLPRCHATYIPGGGHLIMVSHMEEILSDLLAAEA